MHVAIEVRVDTYYGNTAALKGVNKWGSWGMGSACEGAEVFYLTRGHLAILEGQVQTVILTVVVCEIEMLEPQWGYIKEASQGK